MFNIRAFTYFGTIANLGLATNGYALGPQQPRPESVTKITFSEGTTFSSNGTTFPSESGSGYIKICSPDVGKPILDGKSNFNFIVLGEGNKNELELQCHASCTKTSDKEAEMNFLKQDPWLEGNNTDVGRVWCDKVLSRDESIWKDVKDIKLPDSDKF
ncbi:uncharacterized protein I206_100625 [Kwoniella pini CBS 10737]|uniref:Uncharacterized protein n=1 Tax=Kwoniella pini CBS 10737 TaxID=1296096 RepID=A0A1B9ICM1_9TREE|nr:uncharacterized protein I206_00700 [Kwoniella pini CBS 10737]OCF53398.1 hypothetical protein I206_00700 [Kwoniella pini CBS 10737]